jgi:hypothetical protein
MAAICRQVPFAKRKSEAVVHLHKNKRIFSAVMQFYYHAVFNIIALSAKKNQSARKDKKRQFQPICCTTRHFWLRTHIFMCAWRPITMVCQVVAGRSNKSVTNLESKLCTFFVFFD